MRFAHAIGCLTLAPALACGPPPPAAPPTPAVRFITGVPGGSFRTISESLRDELLRLHPEMRLELLPGSGAVGNVAAIEDNSADLGLAFSDVVYLAANGQLEGRATAFEHLAGVAVLQLTPFHVVVSPRESASNINQLRQRIGIGGNRVTGSAITAHLALDVLAPGVSSSQIVSVPAGVAPAMLQDGSINAYLQLTSAPTERVQISLDQGARLLPLSTPQVQQLIAAYPFFKPASILAKQYRGLPQSIQTIGVDSVLVCRKELPESVVHDLVKGLFDARAALTARFGADFLDVDGAPATPIPLHPGAARFYRERELAR